MFDGVKIQIKDVPKPKPSENQALIRVKACGICGTDIAIIQGHLTTPVPLILGHEFAGEVVSIGSEVPVSWIGKHVTAEINTNTCGQCYYCKNQIPTQCEERKALGLKINGAFAEYVAVDAHLLYEVPSSLSFIQATFIEPLAAAYQTFDLMPLDPDDKTLAIFGIGKLGLLILQIAKSKGLEIIAVGGSREKLALAKIFGAFQTINRHSTKNLPQAIKNHTNGLGADIVIDTTGNPQVTEQIIASCRSRGKLHIKSTHGLPTPINLTELVVREITLYTSRCGPFEKAIIALKRGNILVDPLISKIYPLEKIKEALTLQKRNTNNIKIILTM
ncbi:MAG: zinc-binding dehydrogenase [Promethearchaeota archaeon]